MGTHAEPPPPEQELMALRAELAKVDTVPLAERVPVFDRVNALMARHLAALDEV